MSAKSVDAAFESVLTRLPPPVRRSAGGGVTARCPAHRDRGPSLHVSRGSKAVVVHCFAGCSSGAIVDALGMKMTDLFGEDDDKWRREQDTVRHRFRQTPEPVARELLGRELSRLRAVERDRLGYDPPLSSRVINAARARAGAILGVSLAPVAAFEWEGAHPHIDDPAWPTLHAQALEEETRSRWHAIHPEAQAWETDPEGPGLYDRFRAEERAAAWIHEIARG